MGAGVNFRYHLPPSSTSANRVMLNSCEGDHVKLSSDPGITCFGEISPSPYITAGFILYRYQAEIGDTLWCPFELTTVNDG